MTSEFKTNKISPATGTTLTVGDSGDTVDLSTAAVTLPAVSVTAGNLASSLDLSGKTVTLPADTVGTSQIAANAVTTAEILDANVTPAKMSGPVPGAKNLIINGNFDVWQRGTSFTGANDWTADRWLIHANGTSPSTTQQTFTPGQTDVPNFPKYYLRYNAGTSPVDVGEVNQNIEDVGVLGGKQITFSIWAKAASGTPDLGLLIYQNFGSGGSANNTVMSDNSLWTLSTSWQKFTHTVTIDSITGKTVGPSSFTHFRIKMAKDAINKDISQVQVERGAVSTTFESKTYGQELQACERYYQTFGQGMLGWGVGTTWVDTFFQYRTTMRTSPTAILLDTTPVYQELGIANRTGSGSTIVTSDNRVDGTALVRIDGFTGINANKVHVAYNYGNLVIGMDAEL